MEHIWNETTKKRVLLIFIRTINDIEDWNCCVDVKKKPWETDGKLRSLTSHICTYITQNLHIHIQVLISLRMKSEPRKNRLSSSRRHLSLNFPEFSAPKKFRNLAVAVEVRRTFQLGRKFWQGTFLEEFSTFGNYKIAWNLEPTKNCGLFVMRYCWWFRNPANQLRLVVHPTIYRWVLYIPGATTPWCFFWGGTCPSHWFLVSPSRSVNWVREWTFEDLW